MPHPHIKRLAAGQDRRKPGYFQIDNEAFEMGLAPHDFAAYCFMVRRFGDGSRGVYSAVGNMARDAGMSRARFFTAIQNLLARNMISIAAQEAGQTTVYSLTDKSEWHQPVHQVDGGVSTKKTGGVHQMDRGCPPDRQ